MYELYEQIKRSYCPFVLKKQIIREINQKLGEEFIKDDEIEKDFESLVIEKGLEKIIAPGKYQPFFYDRYLDDLLKKYNNPTKLIELAEDYYDVLGLTPVATNEEIKKAYRQLTLEYHPDKLSLSPEKYDEIKEIFIKIDQAFRTLDEEKKRRKYDLCLSTIKSVDEKGKSLTLVENSQKYTVLKDKIVSEEMAEEIIKIIEQELAENELTTKQVAKGYLTYLEEQLKKESEKPRGGNKEWKEQQTKSIEGWKKILDQNWTDYLRDFIRLEMNYEPFLFTAQKYLNAIALVKGIQKKKAGDKEGLEADFAEIESYLNGEPSLKIVNNATEFWGEIHKDFWSYRADLTKFYEEKNVEKEKQYKEGIKLDIQFRREMKKLLLSKLEKIITDGNKFLAGEQIKIESNEIKLLGQEEVNYFVAHLNLLKNQLETGDYEDDDYLDTSWNFVKKERKLRDKGELLPREKLRYTENFEKSLWKDLGRESWKAKESEIQDLTNDLNNWKAISVTKRKENLFSCLKTYVTDCVARLDFNQVNLVQELQNDPKWKVFGASIYETDQAKIDKLITEIITQFEVANQPSTITESEKQAILTFLDEQLYSVQEKTKSSAQRVLFTFKKNMYPWELEKDLAKVKGWLAENYSTKDYRVEIEKSKSLAEAENIRATVIKHLYNYAFHNLASDTSDSGTEGWGDKKFATQILNNFQQKILAELAAAGIDYDKLPITEQNLFKKKKNYWVKGLSRLHYQKQNYNIK